MDEETKRILEDHEKRIRALKGKPKEKKQESSKDYKGLAGGIRLLISGRVLRSTQIFKRDFH